MAEKMVRPFASGTEFMDWEWRNCGECVKSSEGHGTCDLEDALYEGMISGEITQVQADRIGQELNCLEIQYRAPVMPGLEVSQ